MNLGVPRMHIYISYHARRRARCTVKHARGSAGLGTAAAGYCNRWQACRLRPCCYRHSAWLAF